MPLIGFSGAPFTLASYIVEGGHSRNYAHVKKLMYEDPVTFARLMDLISEVVVDYLKAQIAAGAQVGAALRLLGRLAAPLRLRAAACCRTCATWSTR